MQRPANRGRTQQAASGTQRPWPPWGRGGIGGSGSRTEEPVWGQEDHAGIQWVKEELTKLRNDGWEMTGGLLHDHRLVVVLDDGEDEVVLLIELESCPQRRPEVFLAQEGTRPWSSAAGFADLVEEALEAAATTENPSKEPEPPIASVQSVQPKAPARDAEPADIPPRRRSAEDEGFFKKLIGSLTSFWPGADGTRR